jgi:cold shock CspA family protein
MKRQVVSDQDLQVAYAMAQELNEEGADVTEVMKSVGFLRDHLDASRFFQYLDLIADEGKAVVRSGKTQGYYRSIHTVCRRHLESYQSRPEVMVRILGWAARLMHYYAVEGNRRSGIVKWFSDEKGYGFIKPDDGDDVFVHFSETPEKQGLQEGQRVDFTVEISPKGPRACSVRLE